MESIHERRRWRVGREELGDKEGGETLIRVYCMRKESIFNKEGMRSDVRSSSHALSTVKTFLSVQS
jgi:hypothetical protein